MKNLSQEEWKIQLSKDQDAVVLDVRTPEEWGQGVQENAIMMNVMEFDIFQQNASQLDSNKNYYVYCRSGARSVKACQALETIGLDNTFNLLGGMLAWKGKTVIPQ